MASSPLISRRALIGCAAVAAVRLAAGEKAPFDPAGPGPSWHAIPVADAGPIPYFIDDPSPAGRPHDRWLAERALRTWDDALQGLLCMTPKRASESALRIYWGMTGSKLGLMRSIQAGEYRGAEIYVDPQPDKFDPGLTQACADDPLFRDAVVYLTLVHETGHALGLAHTTELDDVMYFGGDFLGYYKAYRAKLATLDDIRRHRGLSREDIDRIRTLYPSQLAAKPPKAEK